MKSNIENTEPTKTLEQKIIDFRATVLVLEESYPLYFKKYGSPHRFEEFFVHRIEQSFEYLQKTRMYLGDCLRLIQVAKTGDNPRLPSFQWTPPVVGEEYKKYFRATALKGIEALTERYQIVRLKYALREIYGEMLEYTENAFESDGASLNDDSPVESYSRFEFSLYWHSALQQLFKSDHYLGLRLEEL